MILTVEKLLFSSTRFHFHKSFHISIFLYELFLLYLVMWNTIFAYKNLVKKSIMTNHIALNPSIERKV